MQDSNYAGRRQVRTHHKFNMGFSQHTDKWDESFLFIIGELVVAVALRQTVVAAASGSIGSGSRRRRVGIEAALEVLFPELTKPRIATIKDALTLDDIDVPLASTSRIRFVAHSSAVIASSSTRSGARFDGSRAK